jgi:hypothetical protein
MLWTQFCFFVVNFLLNLLQMSTIHQVHANFMREFLGDVMSKSCIVKQLSVDLMIWNLKSFAWISCDSVTIRWTGTIGNNCGGEGTKTLAEEPSGACEEGFLDPESGILSSTPIRWASVQRHKQTVFHRRSGWSRAIQKISTHRKSPRIESFQDDQPDINWTSNLSSQ